MEAFEVVVSHEEDSPTRKDPQMALKWLLYQNVLFVPFRRAQLSRVPVFAGCPFWTNPNIDQATEVLWVLRLIPPWGIKVNEKGL